MTRRKFSLRAKDQIIERQGGLCPFCCRSLDEGKTEFDHILPLALGGRDDADNLQAVHSSCHSNFKTALDKARIAKADRQGARKGQQARRAAGKTQKIAPRPFPEGQRKMQSRPFPKPWKPEQAR